MSLELHGYEHSVYAWVARLALADKGVDWTWVEVNPFAADVPQSYLALHPFGRVPTLVHDGFVIYETAAITRYVDEAFDGPPLQSDDPRLRARMTQVISIVDSYAYWPLVRQVFSHAVMGPHVGRQTDPEEVARGLAAAPRILGAIEQAAAPGSFLLGDQPSLADFHLAPMVAYFRAAEAGRELFDRHSRLSAWWAAISARPAFNATRPAILDAVAANG